MSPYWFKPNYQPNPDAPVEFEVRPLKVLMAQDVLATRYANGLFTGESLGAVFVGNVTNWRGIDAPCSRENRMAATNADDTMFGHPVGVWMVWLMDICRHLAEKSLFTETERKNS